MALDFPATPTVGQKYPVPAVAGVPVYSWDGEKWTTYGGLLNPQGPADALPLMDATPAVIGTSVEFAREDHVHPTDTSLVAKAGSTMTGHLSLPITPAAANAVRKDYVDGVISALPPVPNPNVVINGDFRVNQTGYVSAAVLAAAAYGHDQWKAGASGGDYSFTQLKSSTQITIASGKTLIQPIEDVNVVGGSYVLTWTGTAQARAGVNTLTPAGSYAASPLLIAGQTAGTVMSVEFNTGTLGTVKLEIGSNATPFIMRPYDQELMACKRYYRRFVGPSAFGMQGNSSGAASANSFTIPFDPTMRATPTVSNFGTFSLTNISSANHYVTSSNYMLEIVTAGAGQFVYFAQSGAGVSFDARL